ncbi:MAG: threonine dehydratase [Planctomycetota bacterium]|nr:MAG: threonine dehydratase [Planctomycetota bacterium]
MPAGDEPLDGSRREPSEPCPGAPSLADIEQAAARLRGVALPTPLVHSERLSERAGSPVYLKLENLQRTGSFKIRGAYNRCAAIPPEQRARGVICASAGNHGQGVALSARLLGIPATIVMPRGAPYTKIRAIRGHGAEVVLAGENYDEAYAHAQQLCGARGMVFVHAYEDPAIIAGQGTIGLEVVGELPELGTLVVPVGGGGLIAGIAIAARALRPQVRVVGVVASAAPSVRVSLERGEPTSCGPPGYTIADGIRVKQPGTLTFSVIRRLVDEVVEVSEEQIAAGIYELLDAHKLAAEGAGAAAAAAVLAGVARLRGPSCVLVSGGNIDLELLVHVIERGLTESGAYLTLVTTVPDRPGQLTRLLAHLADMELNILQVQHHRAGIRHPVGHVVVEVTAEAREPGHGEEVVQRLCAAGYQARLVR